MTYQYYFMPTGDELANAVNITDCVTSDGVQFAPEEEAEIIRLQSNYQHSVAFTSDDLRKLAEAMNAHVYQKAKRVERAMNTTMSYPTSSPAWARGRK